MEEEIPDNITIAYLNYESKYTERCDTKVYVGPSETSRDFFSGYQEYPY